MSSNPTTSTLVRPASAGVKFCLAARPKSTDLICTRIYNHRGHCCDEIAGESWDDRGRDAVCTTEHDHSKEKGLGDRL